MHCIKSFIVFAFLTLCTVQAKVIEREETTEMATPPEILQPVENEFLKHQAEKNGNIDEYRTKYSNISNDVEVFKDKLGLQKEKQEEDAEIEAEGNEEEQPEVDEPKEEEAGPVEEEPAAQPETELDDNAAPDEDTNSAAEAEAAPAEESQPEEPEQEETPVETEAEEEKKPEPETGLEEGEKETIPNTQTDDSEMPNDEPAKEEENAEKQDESNAPHVGNEPTETLKTKDTDKEQVSCFTCTSNEDVKCPTKPSKQIPCPKVNEADAGKHNGCYTLYQAVTNITTRGCVDELAEEGLKYCLTNDKLCSLCYSSGCNDQAAPSNTAKLQSNIYLLLFLTFSSKIIKYFAN